MIFKKALLFVSLLFSLAVGSAGQEGYRIEVTVAGLQDTTSYLGYHLGDRQFLRDTALVDLQGHFVFEGNERLLPGMYMVILPGNIYFEMIVDQNQHFSVSTHKDKLIDSLSFSNAPDNSAFYEYITFLQHTNQNLTHLRQQLEDPELETDKRQELNDRIQQAEQAVISKQDQYMKDFPDGLFSRILMAQRPPSLEDVTALANEQSDPDYLYQTYKKRFWDHIDFTDDRILRTPVYHAMLNRYINQFVMQIPDTIMAASDFLLGKARANKEVFRYTLWYLTNNAERSQVMGMDAVFVHLVEKYYNTGEAFWISPEGLERISKRANTLAPILIGRTAPNISGFDVNGEQKALHDVEADYLVLYFWESNCAHCREETPVLKDIHEKYHQHGFEVFAMNVETEPENWKEAIERYNASWINVNDVFNRSGFREIYDVYAIPLIYLFDKDKKIIAKKISAGQLDDFMQFELNRMKETGSD